MFKDFEKAEQNEQSDKKNDQETPSNEEDPFMNVLNNLAKNLMSGDASTSNQAMDNIMSEFNTFLNETENNEEMKTALDSVVKEIISKDSLYEPMKSLKDEFPKWLEDNWQKVPQDDLERYNKQLDMITDICKLYEQENFGE